MPSLKEDAIIIAGIGLGVVAIAWYAKYKVGQVADGLADGAVQLWDKATDSAGETVHYFNPWSDDATAYNDLYRYVGANNSTLGGDVYDLWHTGPHPTNEQVKALPMGAGTSLSIYQAITGSKGNQIDDFNNWWDGLWK
jgi:hypothetical protein